MLARVQREHEALATAWVTYEARHLAHVRSTLREEEQAGRAETLLARYRNAVHDAQRRAFEAMRPGVPCREIDRVARASIAAAGYPAGYEVFGHRLGHGIGLEGHEEPYFDGGNELALAAGMTFSDEPGIYLPGNLGVRLEDIVAITAEGAQVFGSWQEDAARP